MRIAVVKPDHNITGGFEIVVDKLIKGLKARGYDVDIIRVDVTKNFHKFLCMPIPDFVYETNNFFFDYLNNIIEFRHLKLEAYDVVISTQPPSFAINHPRHISFFYHHQKMYYDLHDLILQQTTGSFKKIMQKTSAAIVRWIDSKYLNNEIYFLAGSKHIKMRLNKFNGLDRNVSVCYAGIDEDFLNFSGEYSFNFPICVGRHENPKRTELFIHAMKHLPALQGNVIGKGGLTANLQKIDSYLT